jgi:hypothetical protein
MIARTVGVAVLLFMTGCGEGRWRPYDVLHVQLSNPHVTFEAVLETLRVRGYQILETDPARLYLRARSQLDNDIRVGAFYQISVRTSFMTFQVRSDGSLHVGANGFHVRDGGALIHHKLDEERVELMYAIRDLAASRVGGRRPAPPTESD